MLHKNTEREKEQGHSEGLELETERKIDAEEVAYRKKPSGRFIRSRSTDRHSLGKDKDD